MPRSPSFIRLFALIAVLAWSNAQAMACCLMMREQGAVETVEMANSMAEDHSCCPGGAAPDGAKDGAKAAANDTEESSSAATPASSSSSPSSSPNDACANAHQGAAGLCCTHTDPAEHATSLESRSAFVQWAFVVTWHGLVPTPPSASGQSTTFPPALASGDQPRYLTLERILI